jgi:hypothetical protein
MTSGVGERLVQRVQFGRRHRNVDGAASHCEHCDATIVEELPKIASQIIVEDRSPRFGLRGPRRARIRNIVRQICVNQVRRMVF